MVRQNRFKVALGICLLVAIVISLLILTNRKSIQFSGGKTQLDEASALIEFADSIRNSDSDTAIFYYKKAKQLLEQSKSDTKREHVLAMSFNGLSFIYAEKGESKLALKNDSIAFKIATANNDKPIIANAYIQTSKTYDRLSTPYGVVVVN